MAKLKLIISLPSFRCGASHAWRQAGYIYFVALVVLTLVLIGCGGTTRIIEREVKIPYQVEIKDTISLRDTILADEPVWTGEVLDSLNNVIGNLKVFYKRKLAELTVSKKDTVRKIDTIYVEQPFNDFLKETAGDFSLTEKIILYSVAGLAALILLISRKKKQDQQNKENQPKAD